MEVVDRSSFRCQLCECHGIAWTLQSAVHAESYLTGDHDSYLEVIRGMPWLEQHHQVEWATTVDARVATTPPPWPSAAALRYPSSTRRRTCSIMVRLQSSSIKWRWLTVFRLSHTSSNAQAPILEEPLAGTSDAKQANALSSVSGLLPTLACPSRREQLRLRGSAAGIGDGTPDKKWRGRRGSTNGDRQWIKVLDASRSDNINICMK